MVADVHIQEPEVLASKLRMTPSRAPQPGAPLFNVIYASGGTQHVLDPQAVQNAIVELNRTVNYNADRLADTMDFMRWALANEPHVVERYRAALVARSLG